jgi:IS30 family transposase
MAAQELYEQGKTRPKERKLVASTRLLDAVNEGLAQKRSPEQISERLDEDYPDDPEMRVSHECIYQTLYLQARGELRTELTFALRRGRARACHVFRVSHGMRIPLLYHRGSRPGKRTARVFRATFQPHVPVPDSPPLLLEMFRRPR